ncbi:MAG: FecR family protein [Candidatus Acidiferrales bacterium]
MNTRSPMGAVLIAVLILAMTFPAAGMAQAPAGQHAGDIARVIPSVDITRGSQQLTAAVKTPVDWGDLIKTQPDGRARVSLEDGSMLNVGADSTMEITQHNSQQQQTQIDLTYGRVRATVVKFTRPNAKFEMHTAVGVAGVVGGDAYVFFENNMMSVVVFEGTVRLCNLQLVCVDVLAGQIATIRGDHAPDAASQATSEEVADAVASTLVDNGGNAPPPVHHLTTGEIVGLTIVVAIPAIVLPILLKGKPGPVPANGNGCPVGTGTTEPC